MVFLPCDWSDRRETVIVLTDVATLIHHSVLIVLFVHTLPHGH